MKTQILIKPMHYSSIRSIKPDRGFASLPYDLTWFRTTDGRIFLHDHMTVIRPDLFATDKGWAETAAGTGDWAIYASCS